MPKSPVKKHQNRAPGPPRAIAVETPTILPVPRVAARVVARVAKLLRPCPVCASDGCLSGTAALFPVWHFFRGAGTGGWPFRYIFGEKIYRKKTDERRTIKKEAVRSTKTD